MLKVKAQEDQIRVITPYNQDFISRARAANGRFDRSNSEWVFPTAARDVVDTILRDVFAYEGEGAAKHTVRVTLLRDIDGDQEPAMLAGKVIASARGRDSGARPGDDVIYLEGKPRSGGSMRNWLSIAPKGAVIRLTNVNDTALAELRARTSPDRVDRIELEIEEEQPADPLAAFSDDQLLAEARRRGLI